MENKKILVEKLIKENKTISSMESCTGGAFACEITNIDNSSKIFKYGAVTYSNEYKIKMGVNKETIEEYTVYSIEVANEMAKAISKYTNSDYSVGITGQINKQDENNPYGKVGEIFASIYDKENDKTYELKIITSKKTREESKKEIVEEIIKKLKKIV